MMLDDLSADERVEIVAAESDGEGWALAKDVPAEVADRLHRRGIVWFRQGRWQLTALGRTHHPDFE